MHHKLADLRRRVRKLRSAVVCYSGGVDSTFLLRICIDELKDEAIAFTAVSPSIATSELTRAKQVALDMDADHRLVETAEVTNPAYAQNPTNRCYYCKSEVIQSAWQVAKETGREHVLLGTNTDDLKGHRPGLVAAREQGALHPLVEAAMTKDEIRFFSQELGLPTWNQPEMACLSSRFAYGTHITTERLGKVEAFEALLGELGFSGVRVRFHETIARLELPIDQLKRTMDEGIRRTLVDQGRKLGFTYVTVDLQGYRRGAMNEAVGQNQP